MTDEILIAAGRYDPADLEAMRRDYRLIEIGGPDAVADLPQDVREQARALAYKSSAALGAVQMARLPALGLIANYGVGFDAIDIDAAARAGIAVTNTPGVLTDDVADLALGMWIALSRRIVEGDAWIRRGRWAQGRAFPLQRTLTGRRVGIVGLGRIGRAIAERLQPFGAEIHYLSRAPKETPGWSFHADAVALAHAADDLIVAIVGGPETHGIVSAEALTALGSDGVVVNVARGSCIDEEALIGALEAGTIRGAALDVFTTEPRVDPRFLALDNVLLQPHVGSATVETRAAMGRLQRETVAAFFAGRPLPTPVV